MNTLVTTLVDRVLVAWRHETPARRAPIEQAPPVTPPSPTRWQRWHSRRRLAQLSDDQLRDIGLSREQALAEARKPLWR